MVAQRNLVATQFLRHGEEHLPAVPRTEETGAFARVGTRVERGFAHDEAHAAHGGEVLQVGRVAFVVDVGHAHVQGRERELRAVDAGAASSRASESLPPDRPSRMWSPSSSKWYWVSPLLKCRQIRRSRSCASVGCMLLWELVVKGIRNIRPARGRRRRPDGSSAGPVLGTSRWR